jgi:hypothetical protein
MNEKIAKSLKAIAWACVAVAIVSAVFLWLITMSSKHAENVTSDNAVLEGKLSSYGHCNVQSTFAITDEHVRRKVTMVTLRCVKRE